MARFDNERRAIPVPLFNIPPTPFRSRTVLFASQPSPPVSPLTSRSPPLCPFSQVYCCSMVDLKLVSELYYAAHTAVAAAPTRALAWCLQELCILLGMQANNER